MGEGEVSGGDSSDESSGGEGVVEEAGGDGEGQRLMEMEKCGGGGEDGEKVGSRSGQGLPLHWKEKTFESKVEELGTNFGVFFHE